MGYGINKGLSNEWVNYGINKGLSNEWVMAILIG